MQRKVKICFGILLIIVAILVISISYTFPSSVSGGKRIPGPGFFPTLLGVILFLGGLYQFGEAKRITDSNKTPFKWSWGSLNIVIIVAALIVYGLLMGVLGYVISTLLFSILLMVRMKASWISGITVSVVVTIFIVLIFGQVFRIQLPVEVLGLPW